jgi:ribosomal protein S10
MLINLKISSKNKDVLILFLKIFNKICYKKNLNFSIKNFQSIKIKKIFTILKSPHVNKTAQDQFQYYVFSKKMKLYTFQSLKLIIIFRKLQFELFPDLKLKTNFLVKTYYLKKFNREIWNPKLYKLKMFQNRRNLLKKYKILLYLKLFDLHGVLKF